MAGPLSDICVLDVTSGPMGGLATMVLADFGADVVKIERPGGDPMRELPSARVWLRGKKSVVLDLEADEGRARLFSLARASDVAVVDLKTASAERLGADYETLRKVNPALVYCHLTGFGPDGPYAGLPAYEGVVAAKSGRMQSFEHLPERDGPVYAPLFVGTHAASQSAISGILAALLRRARTGAGVYLETSLLRGMLPYDQGRGFLQKDLTTKHPDAFPAPPVLPWHEQMPPVFYQAAQCADGRWLQFGNLLPRLFLDFLKAAGLYDEMDPAMRDKPAVSWDPAFREAFRDRMMAHLRTKPAEAWMRIFVEDGGVVAHPFQSTEEAMDDPDITENGHVAEIEGVRGLGPLGRFTETPAEILAGPPAPGRDTEAVLARLSPREAPGRTGGDRDAAPLSGITVLECATVIATPMGCSLLADLGARVIKVEQLGGDPYRGLGAGIGAMRVNYGKESLSLDLKTAEGREIVRKLIARSDILIQNFRPGVPERLGIDYGSARGIRPDIVYVSANGYGRKGPGALRPSTHPVPGAALGGALYQYGEPLPRDPVDLADAREIVRRLGKSNEVNPDPNTALVVASAALIGLYAAKSRGVGQEIFLDMFGANAYANWDGFVAYDGKPDRPMPRWDHRGLSALYRLYQCAEGWLFVGVLTEREWKALCGALDGRRLDDPALFGTAEARRANDDVLAERLATIFAQDRADAWEAKLAPLGLGCVRADVDAAAFWVSDPHSVGQGFVAEAEMARWGPITRHGPMARFRGLAGSLGAPVEAGEDNEALLAELGYSESEIGDFYARGILWQTDGLDRAKAAE